MKRNSEVLEDLEELEIESVELKIEIEKINEIGTSRLKENKRKKTKKERETKN